MVAPSLPATLVDVVIAVAALELVAMGAWRLATGRGPAFPGLAANAAAGLCLLGALRSVIGGADAWACAAWLAGAGLSHALDLRCRWRSPGGTQPSTTPHFRRLP